MKIGIDIRNIGKKRTGDEVVFFNLTKNLALIDSENEYELFTDISDEETLKIIRRDLGLENKNNFEIISLETTNRFSWNFWTLATYLRKNPVDVYLTQYITPFFIPKKIKIITIIHDISFNFFPQFIRFSDLFFLKTLIPLSIKRADKVIGVSKFTRDEIMKYYKTDLSKTDFIYNAVSEEFFQLAEGTKSISREDISNVRKKYALPDKFILYIGTLQPRKNLSSLIEAFSFLNEKDRCGAKLVIAGGKSHNYDERIDTATDASKLKEKIYFPGFIEEKDKAVVMAAAEIFVFPSLYEGFGIPILEAMSVGVSVIASDIAPHREIADGSASFFNPNTPGELTENLRTLLASKVSRSKYTLNGKTQVKKFSWQKTAEKMKVIFENLVKK